MASCERHKTKTLQLECTDNWTTLPVGTYVADPSSFCLSAPPVHTEIRVHYIVHMPSRRPELCRPAIDILAKVWGSEAVSSGRWQEIIDPLESALFSTSRIKEGRGWPLALPDASSTQSGAKLRPPASGKEQSKSSAKTLPCWTGRVSAPRLGPNGAAE